MKLWNLLLLGCLILPSVCFADIVVDEKMRVVNGSMLKLGTEAILFQNEEETVLYPLYNIKGYACDGDTILIRLKDQKQFIACYETFNSNNLIVSQDMAIKNIPINSIEYFYPIPALRKMVLSYGLSAGLQCMSFSALNDKIKKISSGETIPNLLWKTGFYLQSEFYLSKELIMRLGFECFYTLPSVVSLITLSNQIEYGSFSIENIKIALPLFINFPISPNFKVGIGFVPSLSYTMSIQEITIGSTSIQNYNYLSLGLEPRVSIDMHILKNIDIGLELGYELFSIENGMMFELKSGILF